MELKLGDAECSFREEIKKYAFVGKRGSVLAKNLNNRLTVYKWQSGKMRDSHGIA